MEGGSLKLYEFDPPEKSYMYRNCLSIATDFQFTFPLTEVRVLIQRRQWSMMTNPTCLHITMPPSRHFTNNSHMACIMIMYKLRTCTKSTEVLGCFGYHVSTQLHNNTTKAFATSCNVEKDSRFRHLFSNQMESDLPRNWKSTGLVT